MLCYVALIIIISESLFYCNFYLTKRFIYFGFIHHEIKLNTDSTQHKITITKRSDQIKLFDLNKNKE